MSKLDNNEVVNYFTEFSQLEKYQAVSGRFTSKEVVIKKLD
jgi:hypothetical protein